MEMDVEAVVGHQLIDQQELVAAMAPADELHEVPVAEPAYHPISDLYSFLPCVEDPLANLLMATAAMPPF